MAITKLWLLVLAFLVVACRSTPPAEKNPRAVVVFKDTTDVVTRVGDTVRVSDEKADRRSLELRTPRQRDSLLVILRKQRALWRAVRPRDYQFLLRVACFCPGQQGWLSIEVRSGQPLRAFNTAGKSVSLTHWNTFSIDGLFDNLERRADINGMVEVAFDPRWHFPATVRTIRLPGPDTWGITEARGLRPIK